MSRSNQKAACQSITGFLSKRADEQSAELANGERAARRRGGVGCRKARAEIHQKAEKARERERRNQEIRSGKQSQKGENQGE